MQKETSVQPEYVVNITPLLGPIAIVVASIIIAFSNIISSNGIVTALSKVSLGSSNSPTAQVEDTPTEKTNLSADKLQEIFNSESHIVLGSADSDNLIMEFSDPSCPYCHFAAGKNSELNSTAAEGRFKLVADGGTYVAPVPEIKKLVEDGSAAYVWAFANGHSNGYLAAQAFYCAYEQDKFWPAHDLLMSYKGYNLINDEVKNDVGKIDKLVDFLKTAVDTNKLKECLSSERYKDEVQRDFDIALSTNFSGTPMYIVNDGVVSGAQPFDVWGSYLK